MPLTDEQLAMSAMNGNQEAFTDLVAAHQRKVYGLALHLLQNQQDAADAAQEAFMRCFMSLQSFDTSRSFGAWLYRIAYNHCLDVLRQRKRTPVVASPRSALVAGPAPADLLQTIQARINSESGRTRHPVASGVLAGMTANVITAAILVALSADSGTSLVLMSTVALVVALLWGAVKGLVFAAMREWLPGNVLIRGFVFGLGAWAVWNAIVGAVSTANSGMLFSTPVVLTVSLIHYVIYGLLISWFYNLLGGRTKGSSRPPGALHGSPMPAMLLLLATLLAGSTGILASPTPTNTIGGSPTAVESPTVNPNATSADTPTDTPTVGLPAGSTSAATSSPAVTTTTPTPTTTTPAVTTLKATPAVTPTPSTTTVTPSPQPTATSKQNASRRIPESRRPVRDQVRDVLPTVLAAPTNRSAYQRVRDVAVLLDFL